MNEKKMEKTTKKRKRCHAVISLLVLIILFTGISYAWFVKKNDMSTLLQIKAPSDIAILGPGGKNLASLDLNYTESDKDLNGKVTVRRVICIQSPAEKFKLEIAHTTNLKGLQFKLYRAEEVHSSDTSNENTVTDDGLTYHYTSQSAINGTYINQKSDDSENGYKYADESKHDINYAASSGNQSYDKVQIHAEPLYWLTQSELDADTGNSITVDGKQNYRTYYVCEISWTETEKETDMFYIFATTK